MKLKDQVAIVTGGAQGIGRAIAVGLAREGAAVVVADLQLDGATETAKEIQAMGREALVLRVDVSRIADIATMIQETVHELGTIDILVNNAGITLRAPFFETTEEVWDRIIDVNLKSMFFCCQHAARVMVEKKKGKIVNLASTSSFTAGRGNVPYDTSKGGVRILTLATAVELAPYNINVNAIAPGLIKTRLTEGAFPSLEALKERARAKAPMGRPGTPDDLVGAAVFLCSADSDYVTGHVLAVDGGWLAQ